MRYILNQVYNKYHVLSQRLIGVVDTLEEANQKAKLRGFSDFQQDPKHEDALKTEPMLFEEDGKVIGSTMLCAILYSEVESAAAESLLNADANAEQETTPEMIKKPETKNSLGDIFNLGA